MKYILLAIVLIGIAGCKKSATYDIHFIEPADHSTFHSGDTVLISIFYSGMDDTGDTIFVWNQTGDPVLLRDLQKLIIAGKNYTYNTEMVITSPPGKTDTIGIYLELHSMRPNISLDYVYRTVYIVN